MDPDRALELFSSLSHSVVRLGLDRIDRALSQLGHPERAYRTLHVAGTNGKGSTCAFAERCLREAGHRVGLYTSPHLIRVNERFCVDGDPISDRALSERLAEVIDQVPQILEQPCPLTYFEVGTLVAFWHFFREKVEVAVIETGLGGRLDATTACQTTVSAIAHLSYDHMELLGSTLEAIAFEKAGIIKPKTPVVTGSQAPGALEVLESVAKSRGSPLFVEGRDFALRQEDAGKGTWAFLGQTVTWPHLTLGLRGPHQRYNAAIALAALEQLALLGIPVPQEAVQIGMSRASWPGRFETISTHPEVVLDGAHNEDGAGALVAAIDELYPQRTVHLVFGVLSDKDHQAMLRALFPRCRTVHLCPPPTPRALPPAAYLPLARSLCPSVLEYPTPREALLGATLAAGTEGLVVCAGSLYLIGALRGSLRIQ